MRGASMAIEFPENLNKLKEGSVAFHITQLEDGRCAVIEVTVWNSEQDAEEYCRVAMQTDEFFPRQITYH